MTQASARGRIRARAIVNVLNKIELKEVQRELDLMGSKWPAYLFMDPESATRCFINEYRRVYKEYLRKVDSIQRSEVALAISELALHKRGAEYTAVYRARQEADALGIEYATYLRIAFDFWTRKQRKNLPRPSQLGMSKWRDRWYRKLEEEWPTHLAVLQLEEFDEFLVENYVGLPAQDRFREVALEIADRRTDLWKRRIEDLVVRRRQLPLEAFRGHASDDLISEIRPEIEDLLEATGPAESPKSPIGMQWQTCFGIPRDHEQPGLPCNDCAQAHGCRVVAEAVEKMMDEAEGSVDPVREIKRKQNVERQRRWREARKAELVAGGWDRDCAAEPD